MKINNLSRVFFRDACIAFIQMDKSTEDLGQESGTAWQESQQMGRTGCGGVQNPQEEEWGFLT